MRSEFMFPAIFDFSDEGVSVEFPDLPGCLTCADNWEEALEMAKDALKGHLTAMEERGYTIPKPSKLDSIELEGNQRTVIVEVNLHDIKVPNKDKPVKKTLTIPAWLNEEAERNHVNFSHLLQDALKAHLGLNDKDPSLKTF